MACLQPTIFPKKLSEKDSLLLIKQLLKVLLLTVHWYAEKTINFCLPIPLVSPSHHRNTYIKRSFLLAATTTSFNSWRINQIKVQILSFFVFILLILLSMFKNLNKLAIMNWFVLLFIWCSNLINLQNFFFQNFTFSSYTNWTLNKSESIFNFPYPLIKISSNWQKAPEWGPYKIHHDTWFGNNICFVELLFDKLFLLAKAGSRLRTDC